MERLNHFSVLFAIDSRVALLFVDACDVQWPIRPPRKVVRWEIPPPFAPFFLSADAQEEQIAQRQFKRSYK
jgi:hypothetical protein